MMIVIVIIVKPIALIVSVMKIFRIIIALIINYISYSKFINKSGSLFTISSEHHFRINNILVIQMYNMLICSENDGINHPL